MSTANDLLLDAFGRSVDEFPAVLDGLTREDVLWRPDAGSNSIGWLLWHAARCEDAQVAAVVGRPQQWPDWYERFALPYPMDAMGYGMSDADVARFDLADPSLLVQYHAAVHAATVDVVSSLTDADYGRIVDRAWDPPVTLGVRLISIVDDVAQHVGQAAYLKGLLQRGARRR